MPPAWPRTVPTSMAPLSHSSLLCRFVPVELSLSQVLRHPYNMDTLLLKAFTPQITTLLHDGSFGPWGKEIVTLNHKVSVLDIEVYCHVLEKLLLHPELGKTQSQFQAAFLYLDSYYGGRLSRPGMQQEWSRWEASKMSTLWQYMWRSISRIGYSRNASIMLLKQAQAHIQDCPAESAQQAEPNDINEDLPSCPLTPLAESSPILIDDSDSDLDVLTTPPMPPLPESPRMREARAMSTSAQCHGEPASTCPPNKSKKQAVCLKRPAAKPQDPPSPQGCISKLLPKWRSWSPAGELGMQVRMGRRVERGSAFWHVRHAGKPFKQIMQVTEILCPACAEEACKQLYVMAHTGYSYQQMVDQKMLWQQQLSSR